MSIDLAKVIEDLRASFAVDPQALGRAEGILDVQVSALRDQPVASTSSPAVIEVAEARLKACEPIIPRARFPFERERIATLMKHVAEATLGEAEALEHPDLVYMVEAAHAAACASDPMGVLAALAGLTLPPEASVTLFREALKPEMLRSSALFAGMIKARGEIPSFGCPVCGSLPCAGTREGVVCCGFCGGLWQAPTGVCFSCKSLELRRLAISGVNGSELSACSDCGEVFGRYRTVPEPLGISLHGILASPIILATRVSVDAPLKLSFRVF